MKVEVYKDPNAALEILNLIYCVIHKDKYKEGMNKIYDFLSINSKSFDKKTFNRIKKYVNKFEKTCVLEKSWNDKYFKTIEIEKNFGISQIMLYQLDMDQLKEINSCINDFEDDFFRNQLVLNIGQEFEAINSDYNNVYDELLKKSDVNCFIKYLGFLDINPEIKWNLMEIYNNPKEYYKELSDIIIKNEQSYYNAYDEIKDYVNDLMDSFQCDFENIINDIEKNIGIVFDKNKFIKVYPMIVNNNGLTDFDNELTNTTYFYYGILFNHYIKAFKSESMKSKVLGSILNELGDKSKFEILSLLKKKDMYGQELAESLNLTTATISYHMNKLVTMNFVEVERKDSRVYYKLKKEEIKKFAMQLADYFS